VKIGQQLLADGSPLTMSNQLLQCLIGRSGQLRFSQAFPYGLAEPYLENRVNGGLCLSVLPMPTIFLQDLTPEKGEPIIGEIFKDQFSISLRFTIRLRLGQLFLKVYDRAEMSSRILRG
jgi:hypothetical protein